MSDLDTFFSNIRARRVLKDVAERTHRLMPCGEARIATTMMHRGLIRLVDPKLREFPTGYRLTDKGREAVEKYLPGTEIVED